MATDTVILGIIIGTLAAIVYSLRVLILLERRIARMDLNIEALTNRVLQEELKIEREERAIASKIGSRKTTPKSKARSSKKKSTKKKTTKKKAGAKKRK